MPDLPRSWVATVLQESSNSRLLTRRAPPPATGYSQPPPSLQPSQPCPRLSSESRPHETTHLMHCRTGEPSVRKRLKAPRPGCVRGGGSHLRVPWSQPVHTSVRNDASRSMSDNEHETRQIPVGECPRCGDALPKRATGRPPKWCSQRCRRAAYEERRAAANGVLAIELVRPVTTTQEHDLSECVSRVAASPTACRRLLQALTKLARSRDLVGDPRWEPALDAVWRFADAVVQRHPSRSRFQR